MTVYALDHVQLAMPANREEDARLFYGSLLGLPEVAKPANLAARGGVWFQCGAMQIHLGVEADFRPAQKAHPAFLVADLVRVTDHLLGAGCKIKYDQETVEGYDRAFTEDPFGNRIELLQHRHKRVAQSDEAPIQLASYDPSWPLLFEHERALLEQVLARWLTGPIEHIGSTAVPGLIAKPVIDIMAAVESLDASRLAIAAAAQAGYVYYPYRPDAMHWFCKPSAAYRTHQLHLVPVASPLWVERLAFRDSLRNLREVAAEYAELKRCLAQQFEFDREGYTDAKAEFVQRVTRQALSARKQA